MHVSATLLAPDWPVRKATPSDDTARTARSGTVVKTIFLSRPWRAQCTRAPALPPSGHQQGRDSDDGQHHSRRSDQEPGWHTLTILVPLGCPPPQVGGQQTHHSGPAPHPGTSERGGRSIVPATPDHQLRVDTVSADTPPHVAPLGPVPR